MLLFNAPHFMQSVASNIHSGNLGSNMWSVLHLVSCSEIGLFSKT